MKYGEFCLWAVSGAHKNMFEDRIKAGIRWLNDLFKSDVFLPTALTAAYLLAQAQDKLTEGLVKADILLCLFYYTIIFNSLARTQFNLFNDQWQCPINHNVKLKSHHSMIWNVIQIWIFKDAEIIVLYNRSTLSNLIARIYFEN